MPSIFGSLQVPKSVRSPRKGSKEGAAPEIQEVIVTREPGQKLGLIFSYVQNENGNDLVEVADLQIKENRAIVTLIANVQESSNVMAVVFQVLSALGVRASAQAPLRHTQSIAAAASSTRSERGNVQRRAGNAGGKRQQRSALKTSTILSLFFSR